MSKTKRWRVALVGVLIVGPCLLCGIGVTLMRHSFDTVGNTLPAELAAAREAGLTTEPEDLKKLLAIPTDQNAAPEYARAFRMLQTLKPPRTWDRSYLEIARKTLPAKEQGELEDYLLTAAPTIRQIEKAAAMPAVDWKRDWTLGAALTLPEEARLKDSARLLCAEAQRQARDGHMAESFRLLGAAARTAPHASSDRTLIGFLVACSIDMMVTANLATILDLRHDEPTLAQATKFLSGLPPLPTVSDAFDAEMVLQRVTIHGVGSGGTDLSALLPDNEHVENGILSRDPGYRKAWEAKTVHYLLRGYLAAKHGKDWQTIRDGMVSVERDILSDNSLENRLNQQMSAIYSTCPDSWARALASRRLAGLAVAVLHELSQTGKLPTARPSLGAEGIDPFNGKPLGFVQTADGFKVYTVDRDQVDDKGRTSQEGRHGAAGTFDTARTYHVH